MKQIATFLLQFLPFSLLRVFNLLVFFYLFFTEQKYFKLAPNSDLMHWYVILCHLFNSSCLFLFVLFSKTLTIPEKTSPACYRVCCSQFFPNNINNLLFVNYFLVLFVENGNQPTFVLAFERYSSVYSSIKFTAWKVELFRRLNGKWTKPSSNRCICNKSFLF